MSTAIPTTFRPTHTVNGIPVMLCDGPAYTEQEWRDHAAADWERQPDGRWLRQGQAVPAKIEAIRTDRFVVMVSKAKMPSSCWGRYQKIAVVETNGRDVPRRIDIRDRAIIRVVRIWDRCNDGKTDRCAAAKAQREARELADRLNADLPTNCVRL
jgi:hypothetical protein